MNPSFNSNQQPPSADTLLKQGWDCLAKRQINEAIKLSQQLTKHYPNYGVAWYFTAQVAAILSNTKAEIQSLKNACKLTPKEVAWQIALASAYIKSDEIESVLDILKTLDKASLSAVQHNQLGRLFSQVHLPERSIQHYKQAIAKDPNNNEHYYSIAAVQRHCGELAQAKINLDKAVALKSLDIDAHTLKVDLKKQTSADNAIDSLTQLLEQNISLEQKSQVLFALAKSYEDLDDVGKSYLHLDEGNKLKRKSINYNVKQDKDILSSIIETFDKNWWQDTSFKTNEASEQPFTPIFILGMPRTGSTLTDRILTANDQVFSAGELSDFSRLLTRQVQDKFSDKINSKQQFIQASSHIDFAQLGQEYLAAVNAKFSHAGLSDQTSYVIDKLPFNFLYVGLIQKALPHAKIIHVTRHPMDTCYAIYKTLFQQAYPFSYDHKELAEYYIAYRQLMDHWQQFPNLDIHTISYEELVSAPVLSSKKLYQFCQIPWHKDVINIEKNMSASTTASAAQIRQKIYQSSRGKWRQYQHQLAPIKALLTQAGIVCD